jgi:hypothetical protein
VSGNVEADLVTLIVLPTDLAFRWIFNTTLFIAGVFGVAAGGAQNFMTLAAILALNGVAVGGRLAFVESAIIL